MRFTVALFLSLILGLAGCIGDGSTTVFDESSAVVIFPLEVGADAVTCGSETVASGTLTITDSGGATDYTLTPVGDTISFEDDYGVIAGSDIIVTIDLLNADSDVLYSGSSVVDVGNGETVAVVVTLNPNRAVCGDDVPVPKVAVDAVYGSGAYPKQLALHYAFDDARVATETPSGAADSWIESADGVYTGQVRSATDGTITYAEFNADCSTACPSEFPSVLTPQEAISGQDWTWQAWISLRNVAPGSAPSRQVLLDGSCYQPSVDHALRVELVEGASDGLYDSIYVSMMNRETTIALPPASSPNIQGGWVHLVVTHYATDIAVYVNGWTVASVSDLDFVSSIAQWDTDLGFYIGRRHDTPDDEDLRFTGFIDEFKLWDRELYAGEVHAEYELSKADHGYVD